MKYSFLCTRLGDIHKSFAMSRDMNGRREGEEACLSLICVERRLMARKIIFLHVNFVFWCFAFSCSRLPTFSSKQSFVSLPHDPKTIQRAKLFIVTTFCRWQKSDCCCRPRWMRSKQSWRVKNCCRVMGGGVARGRLGQQRRRPKKFSDKNWLKLLSFRIGTLVDCGNFGRLGDWLGGSFRMLAAEK